MAPVTRALSRVHQDKTQLAKLLNFDTVANMDAWMFKPNGKVQTYWKEYYDDYLGPIRDEKQSKKGKGKKPQSTEWLHVVRALEQGEMPGVKKYSQLPPDKTDWQGYDHCAYCLFHLTIANAEIRGSPLYNKGLTQHEKWERLFSVIQRLTHETTDSRGGKKFRARLESNPASDVAATQQASDLASDNNTSQRDVRPECTIPGGGTIQVNWYNAPDPASATKIIERICDVQDYESLERLIEHTFSSDATNPRLPRIESLRLGVTISEENFEEIWEEICEVDEVHRVRMFAECLPVEYRQPPPETKALTIIGEATPGVNHWELLLDEAAAGNPKRYDTFVAMQAYWTAEDKAALQVFSFGGNKALENKYNELKELENIQVCKTSHSDRNVCTTNH